MGIDLSTAFFPFRDSLVFEVLPSNLRTHAIGQVICCGELCIPGHRAIFDRHVERLEAAIDRFNGELPPLKEFILPGGGPAAAACHLARTIARRAERRAWTAAREEKMAAEPMRYLNRLSDLLFVLARVLARHENGQEVLWRHDRGAS